MPMEDRRNGLEKLPGTINLQQESILPSAENEQHKGQPTELANGDVPLTESISQSNNLEHTRKAEEPLLHSSQVSDDPLVENTAVLKSSGDSSPNSGHIEMGNKHNTLKEQPTDDVTAEEPKDSTLPPDHEDFAVKDTLPSNTEDVQINGSKKAIDRERPPEEAAVNNVKTKPSKNMISKETIKSEDITYDNVHSDMPNEAVQRTTCIDNKPEDNCVVLDDLPHSDIINGNNQEQTQQLQSEDIQCREQTINDPPLVQDEVEYTPSHLVHEEESLPTPSTVVSDTDHVVTEATHNSIIYSSETSDKYEKVNIVTEAVSLQREGGHLQDSTSSQEGSTLSDVTHNLKENNLSATVAKTEDDQTIEDSIGTPQDQINNHAQAQDQNSSSITSKDLDNCSIASQDQNTVVAENVADGNASCSEVTKEVESQNTSNQNEATTPVIEPEDDHSQNTIDSPANIIDPSISKLGDAAAEDQITVYVDGAHVNTLNNADETEDGSCSPTSNNNEVDGVNGHSFLATRPRVIQNGSIDDSYTTILSNGNIQHTENYQNFPDVKKSPESSFNTSVGGEDNVLDSSSDMEIFAETIRKLDSPITLSQKRKKPRAPKSPTDYCGLPPIREDYLEKILENDSFSFGLGKKDKSRDLAPMALFRMQSKENAEKLKPKRASAEQSMVLKSLRSQKEPLSGPQETCDKENADVTDVAVKRSRIESIYSGLKSPFATRKENVFSPTVTTVSTITTSFDTPRKEFTPLGKTCDLITTDSVKTAHTAVSEDLAVASSDFSQSTPAEHLLSTFAYSMDNHLETKQADLLPDVNGQPGQNHCETDGKGALPPLESTPDIDKLATDIFYFKGQDQGSSVPSLHSEIPSLQGAEKINPRPGKLVILTEAECGGAVFEVFADIPDCSSWELSPTIFIKTIRGCWILYEHPNFEGRTIPLEEGDIEVTNPWGEEQGEEKPSIPVVIGSLRHVVKDYRVCQIDLFTDPGGLGIMTSYVDDTEELQVYGRLQRTCSIKVHCGVWLIYEESGFQGIPFILEPGEYPDLSFWNTQEAYIGSLRPLKMGSRKVEIANEPKIIVFEKPMFEGRQVELDKETMSFKNLDIPEGSEEEKGLPFITAGSMRVLSGLWVGYERPGFEGHQYLLEEGDYEEWRHWGGYNGLLQSLRPILSDFSTPHMIMYSEKDFDEKGANINVLGIIANMEETGFGLKTQSINVLSGVWVAYECPDFTGEQYILEKGIYSNFTAWGAKNGKISSVQPIVMETLESPWGHFKVEVFSEPDFQGQNQIYEGDVNNVEDSFKIRSCKVSSGRWALYDKEDFSGNLWVLEEGVFPDLCSMGCPRDATIRSLKMINYEFSEPNVVLYGNENFKGRRVKLSKDSTDLQAMGYSPDIMSLEVLGGIWVFYEYANFRGRQLLILPSKIAQWQKFSSWNRIGSLRPLRQKRLYFKLRNKESGMMMSTNGNMEDVKLLRIQVTEENGAEDQIWVYQKGVIRCRIAEDCSLAGVGSLITAGSKLGFNPDEPGTAPVLWNISPEGRIHNRSKPNLVLDIKGGTQYDNQQIILNPVTEGKLSQMWEICVL